MEFTANIHYEPMTTRWVIYGLTAPESDRIRYVGFTRNPHSRRLQHISKARNMKRHPLYDWIRSLLKRGAEPRMVILQDGFGDGWQRTEQDWIEKLRAQGIFNISPGGETPVIPPESRKRAGEKLKSRIFTQEHRDRISSAKTGTRRPDNAHRNREIAARMKGKPLSISEAERERRKASGIAASKNLQRWPDLSEAEREIRRKASSEQMKRVWAERKAANE